MRIAFWGKFVGAVITVYGVLIALQGLFTTLVGVIPGILAYLVGRSIYFSAGHAKAFIYSKGKRVMEVGDILRFAARSFLLIGVIMIIFIVFYGMYLIIAWNYLNG